MYRFETDIIIPQCFPISEVPSVPLSAAVNQVERATHEGSVTITVNWMQPQNFDQFDIDHYNINITSTSGVENITTECGECNTTTVTVSENPNNVQMTTNFIATIAARSKCNETGPTTSASYILSKFYVRSIYIRNAKCDSTLYVFRCLLVLHLTRK